MTMSAELQRRKSMHRAANLVNLRLTSAVNMSSRRANAVSEPVANAMDHAAITASNAIETSIQAGLLFHGTRSGPPSCNLASTNRPMVKIAIAVSWR
jgi:hypothetical protein